MRAHEAGALHGDLGIRGPAWLRTPDDVNALVPQLWPRTVTRGEAGDLTVGGLSVRDLAIEYGTPALGAWSALGVRRSFAGPMNAT